MHCSSKRRHVPVCLSHCTGVSFERTITLLHETRCQTQTGLVSDHFRRDWWPTLRWVVEKQIVNLGEGNGTRLSPCWITEDSVWNVEAHFFSLSFTFATINDYFYGSRTADNQVKTLSARKAVREGYAVHVIADSVYGITVSGHFHWQGESKLENVKK